MVLSLDCFNMENNLDRDGIMECNDFATIGVTALLIVAACLSLLINDTPIVHEANDVMEKPEETLVYAK